MGFHHSIHKKQKPRYWSIADGYYVPEIIPGQEIWKKLQRWNIYPYKTFEHDKGFEFDLDYEPWDSQFKCFDKPHVSSLAV